MSDAQTLAGSRGVYRQGGHAGLLRRMGDWSAMAKLNYVRWFKLIELIN